LIRKVIREATLHNLIVPVFCGSALNYIGVQPVLDAVAYYLPSPLDCPPVRGVHPKKPNAVETRKPNPDEPFCGLVFKILADKHGDLHYLRIYSGELRPNSRVYNPGQDKKENVAQLWRIQADRREMVESAGPGDIVGIIGLRHSITGDTLCETQHPILLETIAFPETVVSMAIEPESTTERKKLADVLEMMKRQDPTFRAKTDEETGQTLISGMGELHLEVIKHRLLRDFRLNVKVHKPRVSYRETIKNSVEVVGECHRNVGGQALFARLRIRLEPYEGIQTTPIVTSTVRDSLPAPLLTAALDELTEHARGGGLFGNPLIRVKITVLGGEIQEENSTDVAFRIAAADAFEKALRAATVVLLEPIMKLEITTPEEHLGDFVADIQQRRGLVTRTTTRGSFTIIEGRVPLSSLFGYSSAMRGMSQGRASSTMEPADYGPAPEEILAAFQ
jgi:elongation factor G